MPRNYVTQGIVFSLKSVGENNKSVCFLTKDNGIIYATLYGGPKSKLKSLVSKWNSGIIYLYCKNSDDLSANVKITDFDVKNYHLSFRENLYKSYAASLASEFIIKTKCAGSIDKCWELSSAFFDGLDIANEAQSVLGTMRFIWRYLQLLGVQPDTSSCISCSKDFFTGNYKCNMLSYNITENGFLCDICAKKENHSNMIVLDYNALMYLDSISKLSPAKVRSISLDDNSLNNIKKLLFFLAEHSAGTSLKSLKAGANIL